MNLVESLSSEYETALGVINILFYFLRLFYWSFFMVFTSFSVHVMKDTQIQVKCNRYID